MRISSMYNALGKLNPFFVKNPHLYPELFSPPLICDNAENFHKLCINYFCTQYIG